MYDKVFRTQVFVFSGIWVLLMAGGRSNLFRDPGALWHTVVGQRILGSGQFIISDPFSFTFAGKPWIAQQWLGECLMALAHRIGGLDSLLVFAATLLAVIYTWLAVRLVRMGIQPLLAVLITAMAMAAGSHHFHVRPHLFTILFTGWTFAVLCDFESGRISVKSLWWLVPLFMLWTNLHGGVLAGFGLLILAVTGWVLARVAHQTSPIDRYRQIAALAAIILCCGLTFLANPYGTKLPLTWTRIMSSTVVARVIQEHAPLMLSQAKWPVIAFALFYLAALLGTLPKRPRVTWLIPLVLFYLAFTRVRHAPLFAITAALAIGEMFPYIRWARYLSSKNVTLLRFSHVWQPPMRWGGVLRMIPLAIIPLLAIVLQFARIPFPVIGSGWAKLDASYWPIELIPKLTEIQTGASEPKYIFNEMQYGGFLIYFVPGMKIFIDDRCELYGDKSLLDYVHAQDSAPQQIDRWQQQYHFHYALTRTGSNFDNYLQRSDNWTPVGKTSAGSLYHWSLNDSRTALHKERIESSGTINPTTKLRCKVNP